MNLWLDAQLPPAIAAWLSERFKVPCEHVRGSPLAAAPDEVIFQSLRKPGNVIVTKDEDFADLVTRLNPPPQFLWLRVGNTTNRALQEFFSASMPKALALLEAGVPLVELSRVP